MTLYMVITADEYELPLAVSTKAQEIADLLGRTKNDIFSAISRKQVSNKRYNGHKYRIIKIEAGEEEETPC